jgi:ELP3 family radical SAM enzyme/protein acetyltransferase
MSEIEDIVKPFWFKNISESNIQKCFNFLNEYYFNKKDLTHIKTDFVNFQKENEFNGILKFGSLITIYKLGKLRNLYVNSYPELELKLKVQNVRENSGVMVFTIFTSAYPSWTKINPDGTKEIVKEYDEKIGKNTGQFSCKYDCSFCPKDPDMPKSYIATEPGVARAIQNDFDPMKQIFDRGQQYISQGHPIDKIEVLVLGGTISSYSNEYITEFMRDIYWSFNVFMDWIFYDKEKAAKLVDYIEFKNKRLRDKLSLEEEIVINETAPCRVIGLTPETRPDQINYSTIKFFRKIGATRIQLGVQHINDDILRYNNRGCYNKHTIQAIKMLKDNGFKVDNHILLDMPCPNTISQSEMIEMDKQMLETINTNPDYKVDQIKIYPCVITPHTTIKTWYDEGKHKPYGETVKVDNNVWKKMTKYEKLSHRLSNPLYSNILNYYSHIHPSIRVNRIIRDIPTNEICGGTTQTGMRSEIDSDMELLGLRSMDIRYREAGSYRFKNKPKFEPVLKELVFESAGGTEHFLSWESDDSDHVLCSFLRLRLSANSGKTNMGKVIFPELVNCALIRELHTYGKVQPCKQNQSYYKNNNILFEDETNKTQHRGLGKKLLARAEEIALSNGYNKIAVIAGVGVREYYRSVGYTIDSVEGCYQIKMLKKSKSAIFLNIFNIGFILISILLVFISIIFTK